MAAAENRIKRNSMKEVQQEQSVFVALVGRPNVGKSSMLNSLVGEKVAIVTAKPQTTRTQIKGIITKGALQYVFLDTPGIHKARTRLGERMVQYSARSVSEVDVVVMVFEPYQPLNEAEQVLLDEIKKKKVPAVGVLNKIDTLKKKKDSEAMLETIRSYGVFQKVLETSVAENKGLDELMEVLAAYGVDGPHYFPEDAYTDMPEKALVAEIVREKMLLYLYDEIPHGTAVTVERFKERADKNLIDIDINIYCEKKSHKGIIIGKGGSMLKKIASEARLECEEFLDARVNLQCWVKIKDDWRDNEILLKNLGFEK